jgi:hypothetical protein
MHSTGFLYGPGCEYAGWPETVISSVHRLYASEIDKLESLTGESFSCEN